MTTFLLIILDNIEHLDLGWDIYFLDANSLDESTVNYLNQEIIRVQSEVPPASSLTELIERRQEIINTIDGRTRLLDRNVINPTLVTPSLSDSI
jgi:hypothetical protein